MADERHFTNPFPKKCNEDTNNILDTTKGKLSTKTIEGLQTSAKKLLQLLEKELEMDIDWRDVSIYTGISGYCLLYLHLADALCDGDYLKKSHSFAEKCVRKIKGRRHTFLCGDAGPLALASVTYSKFNMDKECEDCIKGLKKLGRDVLNPSSGLPDEVLYGRTGYLYALLFVQKKIGKHVIEDQIIRSVISAVLDSGQSFARKEKLHVPLMYEWHEKKYIGAAHGLMGILFMLLQVKEHLSSEELHDKVKPTVDYICNLQFPSGNMPSSLANETDRLVHWCHGAPGAVFLLAKAYQVFGDQSYLDHAKKAAACVWERGLLFKGYGLCHGSSGNGYALLYMYQITENTEYLYQAAQFAQWCQKYGQHGCRTPDRPMSLFEGLAGNVYFLSDLIKPKEAKFPAFVI